MMEESTSLNKFDYQIKKLLKQVKDLEQNEIDVDATLQIYSFKETEREDKKDTDFGYIGRSLKGPWDSDRTVYNGIKALGADSILVGHEHCNSASVVYDGIRFQYGQKIGEYDRINFRSESGQIIGFIAIASSLFSAEQLWNFPNRREKFQTHIFTIAVNKIIN